MSTFNTDNIVSSSLSATSVTGLTYYSGVTTLSTVIQTNITNSQSAMTATTIFNFSAETDSVTQTITGSSITFSNFKSATFIPIETTETSLDDFMLNGVIFNIENIIDNVSFDIRGKALNNASGNYTIKYKIIYS